MAGGTAGRHDPDMSTTATDAIILTVLNGMAGSDPAAAMDRLQAWGIDWLDLKDAWFGKRVEHWTTDESAQVGALAAARGLAVLSLSSSLGKDAIEGGEAAWRASLAPLAGLVANARILRPRCIRLVAPSLARRAEEPEALAAIDRQSWLMPALREAVDALAATGATVVFENESPGTVFGTPDEVLGFFARLDRPAARMIWDVGNWWHFGCSRLPTVADALALRHLVGVLHLKGGRSERPDGPLRWAAPLSRTSWDVAGVVRTVLAGGACGVICLNPPHGERSPDLPCDYGDDLRYIRTTFPEILK